MEFQIDEITIKRVDKKEEKKVIKETAFACALIPEGIFQTAAPIGISALLFLDMIKQLSLCGLPSNLQCRNKSGSLNSTLAYPLSCNGCGGRKIG